ncbi:unnamed protein product [Diatraea saccharalis]|uniref:Cilia- and flagella-associated protein 206 n=1 Tax=Diatraea saccharalis TaxID=40085 RepID=A0A9P0G2T7_9NEOP|nr:unnamed protein product [Diatraea saccharalis]
MACNENIVKNIAKEITRNCQAQNVIVDTEFVIYLVELLLLNPKYGKLFTKTINRNNLQFFVEECVDLLTRGDTSLNTLKMQFIMQTNYGKLQNLIDKHSESISACLRPLVDEILDAEPPEGAHADCTKLFRKISIYIVLASGLGNPGVITTLKEGMAALESVFSLDDLKMFVALPRNEKMEQLEELMEIVSGVRLFNRDCKKSGEGIPDHLEPSLNIGNTKASFQTAGKRPVMRLVLYIIERLCSDRKQSAKRLHTSVLLVPVLFLQNISEEAVTLVDLTGGRRCARIYMPTNSKKEREGPSVHPLSFGGKCRAVPFNLVDAGKACLGSLSHALMAAMQRVNALTSAAHGRVAAARDTGNVHVDPPPDTDLTVDNYKEIFQLLAFNRQYELFIRKLLSDVETMVDNAVACVDRAKAVLEELHAAVKYKAAVPVVTVFPLFARLWQVWRAMQNIMYLVSTVNRLMCTLAAIQDQMKIPYNILDAMLKGKQVVTDQDRMTATVSMEERLSLGSVRNYVANNESAAVVKDTHVEFLGFCALCLCIGALVPRHAAVGAIKWGGRRYGFCSVNMAVTFSRDPARYVNEVLHYARNNPHVIHLLNILEDVYKVKDVDILVTEHVPKIQVMDKDIQTEVHPVESYIEKNYSWDLWKWKRRACQWATIVNCKTHSTQTKYSHMRAEIQCQTVQRRDASLQTARARATCTPHRAHFVWGLRGQRGLGQHTQDFTDFAHSEKKKAQVISTCSWPCYEPEVATSDPACSEHDDDNI